MYLWADSVLKLGKDGLYWYYLQRWHRYTLYVEAIDRNSYGGSIVIDILT